MTYPAPSPVYLGPPYRKTKGSNRPIKRIVLHGTVSPTVRGGARATAAYFRGVSATGSAHYVVDPGETVQAAWDSVICWHAPPNQGSLGIEFTDWVGTGPSRSTPLPYSRWNDADHTAMLVRGARLVAELCLAYNVPVRMVGPVRLKLGINGICEHSDVSKAFGESTHWDLGNFPRRRFIRMVRAEVAAIRAGRKRSPVHETPKAVDVLDRAEQTVRNGTKAAARRRARHAATPRPRPER